MIGAMPRSFKNLRMLSLLYPLAPANRLGRLFGLPRFCLMCTFLRIGSRRFESCTWPAVTSTSSGVLLPSTRGWIFVPKPPRERPKAWSEGSSG